MAQSRHLFTVRFVIYVRDKLWAVILYAKAQELQKRIATCLSEDYGKRGSSRIIIEKKVESRQVECGERPHDRHQGKSKGTELLPG